MISCFSRVWLFCHPVDYSPPGSSVHGVFQARILEWVVIASSRGSSWPMDWTCISYVFCTGRRVLYYLCHLGSPWVHSVQFSSVQSLSRVRLFATPWITARQASLSITNSRSSLRLISIESVMPSSHLILCRYRLLKHYYIDVYVDLFVFCGYVQLPCNRYFL